MRTKIPFLLLALLALSGCLRKEYAEQENVLLVDGRETLTVDAEKLGEDNVYEDVVEVPITVRANRSWSAVIQYDGEETDWLELSAEESLNLHQYSIDDVVTVLAARNKATESRSARIIISEDAQDILTLPVVQKGQARFITATPNRDKALAILDTINVAVACNTAWTAEVDPSSTAVVKLMAPEDEEAKETAEGEDYGTLKVCFYENDSSEQEMAAVIKLTADGCDPYELHLDQAKGEPYVAFKTDDNTVIPTTAQTFEIQYASNCHWYMAVDSEQNFPGCVLSQTEGDASPFGTVTLSYDFGKDPCVQKSVRLKMWAEGLDPVYLNLTQYGCLHIDLMNLADETTLYRWHNEPNYGVGHVIDNNLHTGWWYNPDYDYETGKNPGAPWPFETPSFTGFPTGSAASLKDGIYDFVTPEGYVFKMKAAGSTGIWFHWHQQGFLVGSTKLETWIQFPVIEGKKLTTIVWEPSYCGGGGVTTGMRDENGNVIPCSLTIDHMGTVTTQSNVSQYKNDKSATGNKPNAEHLYSVTWQPVDPQPGGIIRQTLIYAGNISVKEYTLIYE